MILFAYTKYLIMLFTLYKIIYSILILSVTATHTTHHTCTTPAHASTSPAPHQPRQTRQPHTSATSAARPVRSKIAIATLPPLTTRGGCSGKVRQTLRVRGSKRGLGYPPQHLNRKNRVDLPKRLTAGGWGRLRTPVVR